MIPLPPPPVVFEKPVAGVVTQEPSARHQAWDFSCFPGAPVIAVHDGKTSVERSYTHGIVIYLTSEDGRVSSYSHMSASKAPGTYSRGDVIGYCGNTGIWSSGPHVHFESNMPYRF